MFSAKGIGVGRRMREAENRNRKQELPDGRSMFVTTAALPIIVLGIKTLVSAIASSTSHAILSSMVNHVPGYNVENGVWFAVEPVLKGCPPLL